MVYELARYCCIPRDGHIWHHERSKSTASLNLNQFGVEVQLDMQTLSLSFRDIILRSMWHSENKEMTVCKWLNDL